MNQDFTLKIEEIIVLLRDRLGVRAGSGFDAKVQKAGRRLPRWARKDAKVISDAMSLMTHPKLSVQVDVIRVNRALNNLKSHLETVDPWARRRGKLLDIITMIAFVVFVVIAMTLGFMIWRGLV